MSEEWRPKQLCHIPLASLSQSLLASQSHSVPARLDVETDESPGNQGAPTAGNKAMDLNQFIEQECMTVCHMV